MKNKNSDAAIESIVDSFHLAIDNFAIYWGKEYFTYSWLLDSLDKINILLDKKSITEGHIVSIEGDFTPVTISFLISLIRKKAIIVPLNTTSKNNESLKKIPKINYEIKINKDDTFSINKINSKIISNKFFQKLNTSGHPGLVLFSSGSSGEPKAAVHDLELLLKKFGKGRSKALVTLNFLMFDHWGGLNTMFHILSSGGTVISTKKRDPESVCKMIEEHKIQLLPVSPSFLNLLLLSNSYKKYNLNSLRIISYGTEPMPQFTLDRIKNKFPDVKLLQTYGLIELGVMRSKSESNESLWMKIEDDNYKIRVVDGILQIKSKSAMLGYLNAESPFTNDGWFITGDQVLEKKGYIKILGRKSEIINIGGEKVYPQEIENIILKIENIVDVTVTSEKNAILGKTIKAIVCLKEPEERKIISRRVRNFCKEHLEPYKIPQKVEILENKLFSQRFKKIRNFK